MSGPWEKYQKQGPWTKYASTPATDYRGEGGGRGTGLEAALIGARQGVTFGFGDEINAGVRAAGDFLGGKPFGESYNKRLEHERGLLDQTRRENPKSTLAGEVGGAVLPSLLLPGSSAASLPAAMGKGAAAGAATGAAYGFGNAEGGAKERASGAAYGGAAGALFGGAASAAFYGAAKGVRAAVGKAGPPTLDGLKDAKTAAYKAVEDTGEAFGPNELKSMSQGVKDELAQSYYFLPEVEKAGKATAEKLKQLDGIAERPLTLGQLDKYRQSVWDLYNKTGETTLLDIVDGIDNLVDSRPETSSVMSAARAANARFKKSELLEHAFKKAEDQTSSTGSGGNILNKYRQAVTAIVNNPKQAKWFSEEEKAVMQRLIDGNLTENVLRRIGKLAPTGNGLMLALNLLGGAQFGAGGLAVTAGATAAKAIADQSGARLAQEALRTVSGAPAPPPVNIPAGVNAVSGLLAGR